MSPERFDGIFFDLDGTLTNRPESLMATINSVLGPLDSKDLGFTLMHEHVMVAASGLSTHYPDLLGPNREQRAIAALKKAKAGGIQTMLDATTFDLGRDPQLLKPSPKPRASI